MHVLRDKNLQIIIAIVVFAVTGGSLVGPILPAMLGPLGVAEEKIGLVMSFYTFFAMASTPVLGLIADKIGRRPVIAFCAALFGAAGFGITLCDTFVPVLVMRSLQGIGVGGMMNTSVTLIGDLFSGNERAQAMGYRISFQTITNSFVPFVSGALATLAWFYPFYIYTLAVPVGVVAAMKLKERRAPTDERKPRRADYFKGLLRHIAHHRSIWVFFSNFMAFVLLYSIVVYVPILIVKRFGLTTAHAGFAITFASGAAAIVSSQSGRIMRNFSEYSIILTGFVLCSTALLTISSVESYHTLLPCFIIWGGGFGLALPTLNTCAAGLAPLQMRAGVVSIFTTVMYLGQTVSPPIFGYILAGSELDTVFRTAGLLGLVPITFTLIEYAINRQSDT